MQLNFFVKSTKKIHVNKYVSLIYSDLSDIVTAGFLCLYGAEKTNNFNSFHSPCSHLISSVVLFNKKKDIQGVHKVFAQYKKNILKR